MTEIQDTTIEDTAADRRRAPEAVATEADERPPARLRLWMLIPALGALSVLLVFMLGLQREDGGRNLPSTLIGKPAPEFSLPPLFEGEPGFSTADLRTPGAKIVNFWASWCVACRAEHAQLVRLKEMGVPIHSINYKDEPEAAKKFLAELGNPFTLIGTDRKGRAGIEWGVYGIPETFVIDGEGRVVYKHIGPIQASDIERRILPAIEKAGGIPSG